MGRTITQLALSDLHTGAPGIVPEIMYKNICDNVYPLLNDDLDILTISGDFTDTALQITNISGLYTIRIANELMALAKQHNFYIRIVRGTYNHDRNQLNLFKLNDEVLDGYKLVKVYDNIGYEYLKPLDLKILYIPDDLQYEDDLEVAKELLKQHDVSKVDIALTHCYYTHHFSRDLYQYVDKLIDSDEMCKLVNAYVLNGHIHSSSIYKKIITVGSLERLRHGEEEKKGFFKLRYDKSSGKCTHEFIENKGALTFKTINLLAYENDHNKAIEYYKKVLHTLSIDNNTPVYIRLITNDAILKEVITKYTNSAYKKILISSDRSKDKKIEDNTVVSTVKELPKITPSNINLLTHKFLSKDFNIVTSMDDINEVFLAIA